MPTAMPTDTWPGNDDENEGYTTVDEETTGDEAVSNDEDTNFDSGSAEELIESGSGETVGFDTA